MSNNLARCYNQRAMKTLGIALFTVLCAAGGVAQTPKAPTPQQSPKPAATDQGTLRVSSTLVNTVFAVADRNGKGKFVTNLKQEDFKIYEDDKQQVITKFDKETNLPLSIALLVDTSGSIRDRLLLEQEAAISFFYDNLHRGKDRGVVISFDSGVDLLTPNFTDDPEELAKAVRNIKAGGGTSLYDAVYLAISGGGDFPGLAKEPDDRRKVLILISDGDDNSSRVSLTETLELAQRNDVTVYCISSNQSKYFSDKEAERGDKTLQKFAAETGGRASFPGKLEDVGNDFRDIGEELRSQYIIAYRPIKPDDGTFRRIRIDVVSNKSYKARHRTGYYSPKPSSMQ
jgi:VWFA-related protein